MNVRRGLYAAAYAIRCAGATCIAATLIFSMLCTSVAQEPVTSTTRFGDLSHLQFTATGPLSAVFVAPLSGEASPITAAEVVVSTVKGAGVELTADGTVVPDKQLGKRTVNVKTGETRYFFYGVPLTPGPNTLTAVPLGADGLRGAAVSETVYGPGEPASIQADFAQHIIADGKTVVPMRVWIRDEYGHAAEPGATVSVTIVRGDARIDDPLATRPQPTAQPQLPAPGPSVSTLARTAADPAPAGQTVQETLQPGAYVQIGILPGTQSGPLEVELAAGDAHLRKTFYIEPFLRKPLVDGIVSLGAGTIADGIDGDGIPDGGGSRRARVALFASGKVGKKSLLTVAYESQNRLSPVSSYGPFVEDPNERPYQTYGDSSAVASPLRSGDHLYARLENDRSSITWGQFNAQVGSLGAGAYHQLLSGAHLHAAGHNGRLTFDAFGARNDMAFVSQVLPVQGLSTLMSQLRPNIVVGSDYLELVALDRRSGAVVSETPLTRNVDYTIDYATGVLRFINVPLPYDGNFNPQVIHLQYQYQGPGVLSQTTGGSIDVHLGADAATRLHLGYVNDATGTQNFALLSQELVRIWRGGGFSLSHATSFGNMPNPGDPFPSGRGGNALTFDLHERTPRNSLALNFQNTTAGFANPFGGLSMPGLLAYRAAVTHTVPNRVAVTLEADGQSNHGVGVADSENNQSIIARWLASKRLTLIAGLMHHAQHIGSASTPEPSPLPVLASDTQTQAQLGLEYKAAKRVGVTVQQFRTLSGSDAGSTQPSQTLAQFDYEFPGRGRVYLRELWSAAPTTTFANASSGITFGSGSTHSMQLGFERALSSATTISSAYVVSGTGSAKNVYTALGVQEKFKFSKRLGGNVLAQSAKAVGAGAQGFTLLGGMLNYANAGVLRASLAYQARSGSAGGATFSAGAAGHLSPNLAVLGTLQRAYGANAQSIDDKVTLAYRPLQNDRFISLFSYERSNGGFWSGGAASVLSWEALLRPTGRMELAAHLAYKIDGDAYYQAHTSVLALRARQKIGKYFDAGAETRILEVPGAAGARSADFAAEAGYSARQTRFALGYNFFKSADPTLTGQPQRRGFYFTVTTLLDSIFGWGKGKR